MAIVITATGGNIVANDIILHQFYLHQNGQIGIAGLAFRATNTITGGPSAGEAAAQLQSSYAPFLSPCCFNAVKLLGSKVSFLKPIPRKASGIASDTASGSGGAGTLPGQTSSIITWQTTLAGARNRGRAYVPFPPSAAQDTDNSPTAGFKATLQSLADQWAVPVTIVGTTGSIDLQPTIFHRATNDDTLVLVGLARKKWATQRRRGDYGRPNPPFIA